MLEFIYFVGFMVGSLLLDVRFGLGVVLCTVVV